MIAFLSTYFHFDTLLYRLLAFLLALTAHDVAHALTARLLGDRTPQEQGRLSLNPLAHIDALGLAMILFGPYGWTRPLPVHSENFTDKPRLRHTLVYAAGPVMNLLLVFFFWWLYFAFQAGESVTVEAWKSLLQYCVIVNLMYVLIHLLPLYPLDGWFVLKGLIPPAKQEWFTHNERYGLILVLVLFVTPIGHWALEHIYPLAAQLVMNVFSL
jgi:Zn-dependent protease